MADELTQTSPAEPAPRAGATYTVDLEPKLAPDSVAERAQRVARGVGSAVMIGISVMVGDNPPGASMADLVVRRRADDTEAMRVGAGSVEEAADLLQHVRDQLDKLTVGEFEQRWGLSGEPVGHQLRAADP